MNAILSQKDEIGAKTRGDNNEHRNPSYDIGFNLNFMMSA